MASPNIVFRAVGQLADRIGERARDSEPTPRVLSETARRDLTRHYAAMVADLEAVTLDTGEASLLCDMLNAAHVDDDGLLVRHLHHEVADAVDELAGKWAVDGPALVAKVKGWTPGQRLAVIDAVERWWAGDHTDREAALWRVGLIGRDR